MPASPDGSLVSATQANTPTVRCYRRGAIYDNGGNDIVNAGLGNATVYAGAGDVTFAGWNNQVTLNGTVAGRITDQGNALRINAASSTQTDTITGFGTSDPYGVVDLKSGAGGYASVNAIIQALHSDGHGGTILALGPTGSIDFLGTAPGQLHAANFAIG